MRNCCYICNYFKGRRGYRMGSCDKIQSTINYQIVEDREGIFFTTNTFPIVHAKGVCNKFKEIEIE